MVTRQRIALLLIGIGCSLLIALILFAMGGYILALIMLSQPGFAFGMPQDCPGVGVMVSGRVIDAHRRPIVGAVVSVKQLGSFSDPNDNLIDLTLTTDAEGYFSADSSFHHCLCDALVFEITAAGYHDKKFWYYLTDYYTEAEITTVGANQATVEILLLRAVP